MAEFLRTILVVPLVNVLMFFYDTVAFGNLGVAVIELTIALRLALLPLTIVSEADARTYEMLDAEVDRIQKHFRNDPVQAQEQVRGLLKKHRVNYWAKALVLLIQLAALIVLYKVFIRGIYANLDGLYSWVSRPEEVNAAFFGFELGQRNFWWSLAVGVILYIEIVIDQRKVEHLLGKRDAVYRYGFPIFTVLILSLLPMVKSIFILTSMFFSSFVSFIRRAFWPALHDHGHETPAKPAPSGH